MTNQATANLPSELKGQLTKLFDTPETVDGFKKPVGLVQMAFGKLGFLHRKINNSLHANAARGLEKGQTTHFIDVGRLAFLSGYNSNDIRQLYDCGGDLVETKVEFIDFDNKKRKSRQRERGYTTILSEFVLQEDGVIRYSYSPSMAEMIAKSNEYIWMSCEVQRKFSSKYDLATYENTIRYVGVGTTGLKPLEQWRSIWGATDEYYDAFKRLKEKVISRSVKGVNEKSGILIEPFYETKGRKVVGLGFKVEQNQQEQIFDYQRNNEIRNLPFYKDMTELGMQDAEAIYWVQSKGEQAVSEIVAYVKEKRPDKNPSGYLANALNKGWGEKTLEQRQEATVQAEKTAAIQAETQKIQTIFIKALEYRFWKAVFEKDQKTEDTELKLELAELENQETLKAELLQRLEGDFAKTEFQNRAWDSRVNGQVIRVFAAEKLERALMSLPDFFKGKGVNYESTNSANAEIEKSAVYQGKLEAITRQFSGREAPDFEKLSLQAFPSLAV